MKLSVQLDDGKLKLKNNKLQYLIATVSKRLLVYSNFQGLQRIMINYPNARPSSRGYLVDNFIKVCVAIRLSISRLICPNEGYVASH